MPFASQGYANLDMGSWIHLPELLSEQWESLYRGEIKTIP